MTEAILRMRDLTARFAVNRRTIYRWIDKHDFPKGDARIGRKGTTWTLAEVEAWEQVAITKQSNQLIKPVDQRVADINWSTDPTFDLSNLLKQRVRVELPPIDCGVYLLFSGDEIVYVGQTINRVVVRLFQHVSDKSFDSFTIIPCSIDKLDFFETFLIYKFKPKYNKRKGKGYATNVGLERFVKELGIV